MDSFLLILSAVLGLLSVGLLIALFLRKSTADAEALRAVLAPLFADHQRLEQTLRDDLVRQRDESSRAAGALRDEVANRIGSGLETIVTRQADAQRGADAKLEGFRAAMESRLREDGESADQRLTRLRQELNDSAAQSRTEMRQAFAEFQTAARDALNESARAQGSQLADFAVKLDKVSETIDQKFEKVRETVEAKLDDLQKKNEQKLEEMRRTVDEKLEGTLDKRLGESFKMVSDRLEAVHKGLGEMQVMASSVGDLKRVLTNVKTRGTWGEVQLGALLEEILTAEQYAANVAPKPGSLERVEFAIRLPGRSEPDRAVWLPIDAKFPQEDYQRLVEAADRGDGDAVSEAGKALEACIRKQARDIAEKYVAPPHTTDFALMFLPSEGLYAEVMRRPGLASALQIESRVVITGPTTLAALLNSLQMGFRTLAIQQRSSEVWSLLGAIKAEFGKFGDVLSKVKEKLDQASKQIEQTEVRSRAISQKLRNVEALPAAPTAAVLPENIVPDPFEEQDDLFNPALEAPPHGRIGK